MWLLLPIVPSVAGDFDTGGQGGKGFLWKGFLFEKGFILLSTTA